MITLRELASWEGRLAVAVERAAGSPDERDRLLARAGVYAEYAAVFGSYASLVSGDEDPDGLEALKRAVFLAWYGVIAPSFLTGIGDLPDSTVRRVLEALEARLRRGQGDDELRAMVAWYVATAEPALLRFPGLDAVSRVAESVAVAGDPRRTIASGGALAGRGLMGAYWRDLATGE